MTVSELRKYLDVCNHPDKTEVIVQTYLVVEGNPIQELEDLDWEDIMYEYKKDGGSLFIMVKVPQKLIEAATK